MDELEEYNPYKEYEKLINEVNQKYKHEKKIPKYTVDNALYFPEFFYQKINDSNIPDKISLYQMKLLYITKETYLNKIKIYSRIDLFDRFFFGRIFSDYF